MPLTNFRFFALHYLNDWCSNDRRFFLGLSPRNEIGARLSTLQQAATYYGVARTLKGCGEKRRLSCALFALDAIPKPETDEAVDSAVDDLAEKFRAKYGNYAVSAASKFLWLRYRSPVIIYDGRAVQRLWKWGGKFDQCDYVGYHQEWRRQFAKYKPAIQSACEELRHVSRFSLADGVPDERLKTVTSSTWFHERVFDKCLWWNAADDEGTTQYKI